MAIGEPILVMDNFKGGVLGFDPQGRCVFIENKNTIFPVTEYKYLTTGIVKEDISLLDGSLYQKGRYVLIFEQSFDKNTYGIILGKDNTIDVPMSKIDLVRNRFSMFADQVGFKTAQN